MEENFYDINNDLLAKFLLKETTQEENLAVQNWLEANEANRKFFGHFQIIWEESKTLPTYEPVSDIEAWERFRERIHADHSARIIQMHGKWQWDIDESGSCTDFCDCRCLVNLLSF